MIGYCRRRLIEQLFGGERWRRHVQPRRHVGCLSGVCRLIRQILGAGFVRGLSCSLVTDEVEGRQQSDQSDFAQAQAVARGQALNRVLSFLLGFRPR